MEIFIIWCGFKIINSLIIFLECMDIVMKFDVWFNVIIMIIYIK